MFETRLFLDACAAVHVDRPAGADHARLLNQAVSRFNRARWNGTLEKIKNSLLRRTRALFDIATMPLQQVRAQRHGGLKPVSLGRICGTLGRVGDFDSRFYPLEDRIRDRWVSIAMARSQNIPLEPVELIQVGEYFFVKDGHHRISVARALGESAIDAEITIWEVSGALPWEEASAAHVILQPV